MAEGANYDFIMIRRLNMLPELTKAHCSMLGSWGKASQDEDLI